MSPLAILLLVLLVLVIVGGAPRWGYHRYGWGPSGFGALLLILLVVLLATGRL